MELNIGSGEGRKSAFKWNVFYFKGKTTEKLKERWEALPKEAAFFFQLRNIARLYSQLTNSKRRIIGKWNLTRKPSWK